MRAWLFQDTRQQQKHGDKAPWSVGWLDPKKRRRSCIDEHSLDTFVAKRLKMRGKKKGATVAAETVKKELRTIRAAQRESAGIGGPMCSRGKLFRRRTRGCSP